MIKPLQLTKNFNLLEFFVSAQYPAYARDYVITEQVKYNFFLIAKILQPIRTYINMPFQILSGARNEKLNRLIGGSANSQHIVAQAADFTVNRKKKLFEIFQMLILQSEYITGQIILYLSDEKTPRFLHISLPNIEKKYKPNNILVHYNNNYDNNWKKYIYI